MAMEIFLLFLSRNCEFDCFRPKISSVNGDSVLESFDCLSNDDEVPVYFSDGNKIHG